MDKQSKKKKKNALLPLLEKKIPNNLPDFIIFDALEIENYLSTREVDKLTRNINEHSSQDPNLSFIEITKKSKSQL